MNEWRNLRAGERFPARYQARYRAGAGQQWVWMDAGEAEGWTIEPRDLAWWDLRVPA